MTLSLCQFVFAINLAKLIQFIYASGYTCSTGETWRTPEMAEIYKKKGIGIKDSQHCKKLAADLNLFKDGVYLSNTWEHKPFGEYWMSLNPNNRWGGDWNKNHRTDEGEDDGNHYEMKEASV